MSEKIYIPPIKIQGIKTKLVPLIKKNISFNENMLWIEPFMGSGVVGFNVNPPKAVFSDLNPHLINFYLAIQCGNINSTIIRAFLEKESIKLEYGGAEYYYEVRKRFNEHHSPLDFLFLNRSCFNGMIRFNKSFQFNVPFGHKPKRFSKAYITKIVNQAKHIEDIMANKNWTFICQSYEKTISNYASPLTFVYCDPPYIGRHIDYYDSWDENNEIELKDILLKSNSSFMLSTWDYNKHRQNKYISMVWGECRKINKEHFYHVGANKKNRNPMMEALMINY